MRDDLVPIEIEIDPRVRASTFAATQRFAIKSPGLFETMYRKGKVKLTVHLLFSN
jgi:hypothetical protein